MGHYLGTFVAAKKKGYTRPYFYLFNKYLQNKGKGNYLLMVQISL